MLLCIQMRETSYNKKGTLDISMLSGPIKLGYHLIIAELGGCFILQALLLAATK